jgi:hypothetical protein
MELKITDNFGMYRPVSWSANVLDKSGDWSLNGRQVSLQRKLKYPTKPARGPGGPLPFFPIPGA